MSQDRINKNGRLIPGRSHQEAARPRLGTVAGNDRTDGLTSMPPLIAAITPAHRISPQNRSGPGSSDGSSPSTGLVGNGLGIGGVGADSGTDNPSASSHLLNHHLTMRTSGPRGRGGGTAIPTPHARVTGRGARLRGSGIMLLV